MGFKNLTPWQASRFFLRLFDCHVLGRPPCHKSGSPVKIITRFGFYSLGFLQALQTVVRSFWDDGQIYSRKSQQGTSVTLTQEAGATP